MRNLRGFTLLELLVVLAIAATMAALAPMAFDKLRDSSEYRNTLRTIMADMRSARHQAVTRGNEVRFHVNLEQRTYGVDGQTPHKLPDSLEMRVVVADQEIASNQEAAIAFLPAGGATGGSVDVVRASGGGIRMRVDWLSGRVIQDPLPQ